MPSSSADLLYDAIIVGAGPSGCSTALSLARAGHQVLILDKAAFPREKVCGDAVSGKSIGVLRRLGLLPALETPTHGVIRGLKMVAPSGQEVRVPFPNADGLECAGYCLRRQTTDSLLQAALRREPTITVLERFTITRLERDADGRVCAITGRPSDSIDSLGTRSAPAPSPSASVSSGPSTPAPSGASPASASPISVSSASPTTPAPAPGERTLRARVIVGADGANSIVARQLALPPVPPEHLFMAIRGYWTGVTGLSDCIELFFIDQVLPGYLWVFPMGDGTANVGLGILASDVKARAKHPNKVLTDALLNHPQLAARFKDAQLQGSIGAWTIPNGSHIRPSVGDGWVLVGDAASLVDPFSGEGVGNALSSGELAAQAINTALGQNPGDSPLPASSLESYRAAVEAQLRPEMKTSYQLQRASRNRFLLNLFIGKAATKPAFRQMIIDMLGSDEKKQQVQDPLFYLKLLLP